MLNIETVRLRVGETTEAFLNFSQTLKKKTNKLKMTKTEKYRQIQILHFTFNTHTHTERERDN